MTADMTPLDTSLDPTVPHRSLLSMDATLPHRPVMEAKSSGLSLRRNFSWTFIGNVVYAAAQWGQLILLAKLTTPAVVGQFNLALAITAPVIMFSNLQLRAVQATDAKREYGPGHYLALRLLMTLLAMLVIGMLVLTGDNSPETGWVILIIGLAKGIEAISDVLFGLLQQRERMDYIAKSMIIKGILSLVTMAAAVALTRSMVWGSAALFLSWTAVLFLYDIPSVRRMAALKSNTDDDLTPEEAITPRWEWRRLLRLIWLSLPLGFVMMLISLNSNIPRYFVENFHNETELGIFSAMAYLMIAGTFVINALGQSATPRLARYYAENQTGPYISLSLKLLGVGVVIAIAGVVVALIGGKPLLSLIYTPEYAEQSDVFVLLMVAGGVSYVASFAGYTMTAARLFRIQTLLFAVTTAVTYFTSQMLIPEQGGRGAVWVLIIAGVVQLIGSLMITAFGIWRIRNAAKDQSRYA